MHLVSNQIQFMNLHVDENRNEGESIRPHITSSLRLSTEILSYQNGPENRKLQVYEDNMKY